MHNYRQKYFKDNASKYLTNPEYKKQVDLEAAQVLQKLTGPQKIEFQNAIAKYKQDLVNYRKH